MPMYVLIPVKQDRQSKKSITTTTNGQLDSPHRSKGGFSCATPEETMFVILYDFQTVVSSSHDSPIRLERSPTRPPKFLILISRRIVLQAGYLLRSMGSLLGAAPIVPSSVSRLYTSHRTTPSGYLTREDPAPTRLKY